MILLFRQGIRSRRDEDSWKNWVQANVWKNVDDTIKTVSRHEGKPRKLHEWEVWESDDKNYIVVAMTSHMQRMKEKTVRSRLPLNEAWRCFLTKWHAKSVRGDSATVFDFFRSFFIFQLLSIEWHIGI